MDRCKECAYFCPLEIEQKTALEGAIDGALKEIPELEPLLKPLRALGTADGSCRFDPPASKGCNDWPLVTHDGWCGRFVKNG